MICDGKFCGLEVSPSLPGPQDPARVCLASLELAVRDTRCAGPERLLLWAFARILGSGRARRDARRWRRSGLRPKRRFCAGRGLWVRGLPGSSARCVGEGQRRARKVHARCGVRRFTARGGAGFRSGDPCEALEGGAASVLCFQGCPVRRVSSYRTQGWFCVLADLRGRLAYAERSPLSADQ